MSRRIQRVLYRMAMAVLAAGVLTTVTAEGAEALFKAGFAERDITPKLGTERPGGYGKSFLKSIHDPCKVRAAVFDDGKTRVALVGLDALVVPRSTVLTVREGVFRKCGIEPKAILIAASHSHSSGPTGMVLPGEYDHASELAQELAYEKSSCADADYLKLVETAMIDALVEADAGRQESLCGAGSGIEDRVAFNRRFRMKNGLTHTHPGQGNPNIVEVAGPTDPEVGVIGAWDKKGKLIGCIVNFACHATTSPGGISANYIYYLEMVIRGTFGDDVVVVFLAGASGDVTQVDNLSPDRRTGPEQAAQLVGGRIGAEAVKVLLSMPRGSLAPLAASNRVLTFNRRVPSLERLKRCLEMVRKAPQEVGSVEWTFAKEIVMLDALLQKWPTQDAEIQAVQIGPVVFLADPAEYFCQFGLDLKAGSPFPLTFPVSLANGIVGYVPTEEALGRHGGGYETRLTSYSNLEPTAGTTMVKAALEQARAMTPGKIPTPEPAPAFSGDGWSYGNIPPELE